MGLQKYKKSKVDPTAARAVERFFQKNLLPYAPRELDEKIREQLWSEEVRAVCEGPGCSQLTRYE